MRLIWLKSQCHNLLLLSLRGGYFVLLVLFFSEERGNKLLKLLFLLLLFLFFDYALDFGMHHGFLLPPAATLSTWLERKVLDKRCLSLALVNLHDQFLDSLLNV